MSNASTTPAQSIQRPPLRLSAGRMKVEFSWHHDRWAHRIHIDNQPTWESLEGSPATLVPEISDHWPASPVFTEIMLTETTRGPALLGVGLAGRSHFSASLTAASETPDTILVEVACRLHEPPGWLGSVYRRLVSGMAGHMETSSVCISPAPVEAKRIPMTTCWNYRIGLTGIEAVLPASCERLPDQSD